MCRQEVQLFQEIMFQLQFPPLQDLVRIQTCLTRMLTGWKPKCKKLSGMCRQGVRLLKKVMFQLQFPLLQDLMHNFAPEKLLQGSRSGM